MNCLNQIWINKVVETWYQPDNPLFLNPLHPAIGLAEEAGELLGLYKKNSYKPGFDFWKCKYCKMSGHDHLNNTCKIKSYNNLLWDYQFYAPLILDELGDLSYYLRILMHQSNHIPEVFRIEGLNLLDILIGINGAASRLLSSVHRVKAIDPVLLGSATRGFYQACWCLEVEPETVLEMNYEKIQMNNNHGWKR